MKISFGCAWAALVLVIWGAPNHRSWAGEAGVIDRIMAATAPFDNNQIEATHVLPNQTVWAKELFQGGEFKVLARKQFMERYRCSSCHNNDHKMRATDGAVLTHGDIKMNHGQGDHNLTCMQCHHPQDRDALVNKQGDKIDFDHSYQLCGQCHFRQKRDWLGGAHGKRVTYWAGERVIRNCTTCHPPHAPKFAKRLPATYSLPLKK